MLVSNKTEAYSMLESLLESFNIPEHKKASLVWLKKHLKKKNLQNPKYKDVMSLLDFMTKNGWTVK